MICEYCNEEHNGDYGSGRFCDAKCARGFSTKAKRKEINKIVSEKIIGTFTKIKFIKECPICKKEFITSIKTLNKKTCGKKKCIRKQLSNSLKGKTGGYRIKSGRSKFHGGWYKNIWMDSSWELLLAKQLDECKIIWERDITKFFKYTGLDTKEHKYYPDFYLPQYNIWIEIKGYWTEQTKHKMSEIQKNYNINLIILESIKEIEEFVNIL